MVHVCYRRRHDSHSGPSAGQNRSDHSGTVEGVPLERAETADDDDDDDVTDRSVWVLQGSRGLSLFYAEVSRGEDGRLRGIEVQRLKDKLGTRQMPTAELLLDGLLAHRVRYILVLTLRSTDWAQGHQMTGTTDLTPFMVLLPQQLSEEGRGVASIANMLTVTRIHNSISAAAAMRRQDSARARSS